VKDILLKDITRRLTPQAAKLRADIEFTCFHYDGIDAIKAALLKGQAVGTAEIPIKIKLVAPPLFVMTTTSLDEQSGVKLLNDAVDTIKTEITNRKGNLVVKWMPHIVTARETQELNEQLEQLKEAQNNPNVDPDANSSDDETDLKFEDGL